MEFIDIVIILIIILESLNVVSLYVHSDFKYDNSVSVFNSWEDTKSDEALHLFVRYLTYWVAGAKLIFIGLLVVILLLGTTLIKFWSIAMMSVAILSYFWKLNPIIKRLDDLGQITPSGYSKILGVMVTSILVVFNLTMLIYILF